MKVSWLDAAHEAQKIPRTGERRAAEYRVPKSAPGTERDTDLINVMAEFHPECARERLPARDQRLQDLLERQPIFVHNWPRQKSVPRSNAGRRREAAI
jgi:hypothetical protein